MKEHKGDQRRGRLDIMIDQVLPKIFDDELWSIISSMTVETWAIRQKQILDILLGQKRLFQSFFKRFYLNHMQLHNWYMLAKEKQLEMKKYVFRHLLDKSFRDYREMIKEQESKRKFGKSNDLFRAEDKKEKRKESFHKILLGNAKFQKGMNLGCVGEEEKQRKKEQEFQATLEQYSKEDYHQLFLKTFNACDGSKYIYYDFDKHMRGIGQQKNYNNFIRITQHHRNHPSEIQPQPKKGDRKDKQNRRSYFHEGEDGLQKIMYCNYSLKPIGFVTQEGREKSQYVLKKLPNVFRKVNKDMSCKFLRRKQL